MVDDNTNHRGKDGISHHESDWYPGRAHKVDDDHDTFAERFHEDVIEQRLLKQKDWCSKGLLELRMQHQLGIKLAVRGEMIRQGNQRKLSSASKIMLWEEDQVAQLKSARQGYSQTG